LAKYAPVLKKDHKNFKLDRKWQQLSHILDDAAYWPEGLSVTSLRPTRDAHTTSYKKFVIAMMVAIKNGRKITPKMSSAIDGIIKRYVNSKAPNPEREERIEKIIKKLDAVRREMFEARYKDQYHNFLSGLATSAMKFGQLTNNQKIAVNRLYKKARKKNEKEHSYI